MTEWTPETNLIQWGLLTDEQRARMKLAKYGWKFYTPHFELIESEEPIWNKAVVYRATPKPVKKTVYPWAATTKDIQWFVVDENGNAYGCVSKPVLSEENGRWMWSVGIRISTDFLAGYERGDEPWKETLQERPVGV